MPDTHPHSLAVVRRLCGRLLVVAALWALWPGASRGEVAAALSACLAVGCAIAAVMRREPVKSIELNRWFEVLILLIVAALILMMS